MDDDKPYLPRKYRQAAAQPTAGPADNGVLLRQIVALERSITALTRTLGASKPENAPDIKPELQALLEAVRSLKLDPQITVQAADAPAMPPVDLSPLRAALTNLKADVALPDSLTTEQVNVFVDEKFDEYKLEFFDEDDDMPTATTYYLGGKQVARVEYQYNKAGNLVGAKKV